MDREPSASSVAAVAGALAHPVRVSVVSELDARPDDAMGFTTLRDAVDLRDNGRFNYHLDQLRGHLVERRDDGYALTTTGREVAHLLRVGHLADPKRERAVAGAAACHTCGGDLALRCRPRRLWVHCDDCDWVEEVAVRLPAVAFEASPAEARAAVDRTLRTAGRCLADGRCPSCFGAVEPTLTAADASGRSLALTVEADCPDCGPIAVPPGLLAIAHHATAALFHDHGLRLDDRLVWGVAFAVTDHETRIRNRRPWRVEVRPQIGTDELVLLVDDDATVSAAKRHTKFAARDVWYPNRGRS